VNAGSLPRPLRALRALRAFLIFVPFVSLAVAQEGPDRSRPPALAAPPPLELPPIQTRMLTNGLRVWLVESHEVPLVQVSLVVLAGANDDSPGKFGLASFTAAMLDEGAGSRSALDISDSIDFLGASLSTGSSFDASVVRLNVPAARLEQALPIMADVARRPTFPEADLERIREERLTTLLQARDDPGSIASMAFSRALFGPTHRYGTAIMGDEKTLKVTTAADLRGFHAAFYEPSNVTLIVVGDVRADAVLPNLEHAFGDWKTGAPRKRAAIPPVPPPSTRQILLVDKADAEQSQIRIGGPGAARGTPDYFALEVLNTLLGGSFTSRLNQNLREEHGYAYGANSAFDMRVSAGPFLAAAGVQTDKTGPAVQEFFNELNAILKPVPADELQKAKNYVALSYPGEFETTGDLARKLEDLVVYNLPANTYSNFVDEVNKVTAADLQKLAATYIQPDKMAVVIVGDRAKIEADIRKLNLGPINFVTIDELFR